MCGVEHPPGELLADAEHAFAVRPFVVPPAAFPIAGARVVLYIRIGAAPRRAVVGDLEDAREPLTPLLEVERDAGRLALVADRPGPIRVHGPSVRAALATYYCPIDSGQVELSEVFEQRLQGQEADRRRGLPQMDDAVLAGPVLDAGANPDIRERPLAPQVGELDAPSSNVLEHFRDRQHAAAAQAEI